MLRASGVAISLLLLCAPALHAQEAFWEDAHASISEYPLLFISSGDELVLYVRPDLRSPTRTIRYGAGWEVPYLQLFVRTLEEVRHTFLNDAEIEVYCESDENPHEEIETHLTVSAGEVWTYLHYDGEGFLKALVQGRACSFEGTRDLVGGQEPAEPAIQVWVQVRFADGTSPGWLLLQDDGQVTVSSRFI